MNHLFEDKTKGKKDSEQIKEAKLLLLSLIGRSRTFSLQSLLSDVRRYELNPVEVSERYDVDPKTFRGYIGKIINAGLKVEDKSISSDFNKALVEGRTEGLSLEEMRDTLLPREKDVKSNGRDGNLLLGSREIEDDEEHIQYIIQVTASRPAPTLFSKIHITLEETMAVDEEDSEEMEARYRAFRTSISEHVAEELNKCLHSMNWDPIKDRQFQLYKSTCRIAYTDESGSTLNFAHQDQFAGNLSEYSEFMSSSVTEAYDAVLALSAQSPKAIMHVHFQISVASESGKRNRTRLVKPKWK
jgi:hypothetical protein